MKPIKITVTYIFILVCLIPFLNIYIPNISRLVLWSTGFISAFVIFKKYYFKTPIPIEYKLYGSLIVFSIVGLPFIKDLEYFMRYFQVLISNLVLMIMIYFSINNLKDFQAVVKVLFISISILMLYSFQVEGVAARMAEDYYRFEGILGNSNGTAAYARIGIFLGLLNLAWSKSSMWNIIYMTLLTLFMYIIFLSGSRSNFLIIIFGILSYLFFRYFKKVNLSVFVFVVPILFLLILPYVLDYFQDSVMVQRLSRTFEATTLNDLEERELRISLQILAFNTMLDNPFFGVGLNQFRFESGGSISHTDFLDIGSQLGILAMLAYMSIYYLLLKKFIKIFNKVEHDFITKLLLIFFISEVLIGLASPNWFLQLSMIVISLFITYQRKIFDRNALNMG